MKAPIKYEARAIKLTRKSLTRFDLDAASCTGNQSLDLACTQQRSTHDDHND